MAPIRTELLHRNSIAAPSLPISVFGPDWGAWIERAADVANAPADYIALPLLSSASALIGNARWTQNWAGWKEPPNLWCASVGLPSSGKTPGAKTVTMLLRTVEVHLGTGFDELYTAWDEQAARAKAERKEWEKALAAAIAGGDEPPPMPHSVLIPEPMRPVATVTSVTVEKMVEMLAKQPKGFLLAYDELAGWLGNMSGTPTAAQTGHSGWRFGRGARIGLTERLPRRCRLRSCRAPCLGPSSQIGLTPPSRVLKMAWRTDSSGLGRKAEASANPTGCWMW